MPKGKKFGGRDWVKGQSGNPAGKPPLPEDIKAARKLTAAEFERAVNQYLFQDRNAVAQAAANPQTPILELLITSIIHKAVSQGDEKRLAFLLDRILGKVANRIEIDPVTLKKVEEAEQLKAMPNDQLLSLVQRAIASHNRKEAEENEPKPPGPDSSVEP